MTAATVSGAVSIFCMVLSAQFAKVFLSGNSRLFTAMALLACSWTLVSCNYGLYQPKMQLIEVFKEHGIKLPKPDDCKTESSRAQNPNCEALEPITLIDESKFLLTAISSFLFIYSGGLLMLQGKSVRLKERTFKVDFLQYLSLWLLFYCVVPQEVNIPLFALNFSLHQVRAFFDFLARITGFACLGYGAWYIIQKRYFSVFKRHFYLLVGVLFLYAVVEIAYYVYVMRDIDEIPSIIFYFFSLSKVLLTGVLGSIIIILGMPRDIRRQGSWHWLRLLVTTW